MVSSMDTSALLALSDAYTAQTGLSEATLSNKVTGTHAGLFRRIRNGGSCRVDTLQKVVRWFDRNWPEDLEWPEGVIRPSVAQSRGAA